MYSLWWYVMCIVLHPRQIWTLSLESHPCSSICINTEKEIKQQKQNHKTPPGCVTQSFSRSPPPPPRPLAVLQKVYLLINTNMHRPWALRINPARQFKNHEKIETNVFQPLENHKFGHTAPGGLPLESSEIRFVRKISFIGIITFECAILFDALLRWNQFDMVWNRMHILHK